MTTAHCRFDVLLCEVKQRCALCVVQHAVGRCPSCGLLNFLSLSCAAAGSGDRAGGMRMSEPCGFVTYLVALPFMPPVAACWPSRSHCHKVAEPWPVPARWAVVTSIGHGHQALLSTRRFCGARGLCHLV